MRSRLDCPCTAFGKSKICFGFTKNTPKQPRVWPETWTLKSVPPLVPHAQTPLPHPLPRHNYTLAAFILKKNQRHLVIFSVLISADLVHFSYYLRAREWLTRSPRRGPFASSSECFRCKVQLLYVLQGCTGEYAAKALAEEVN